MKIAISLIALIFAILTLVYTNKNNKRTEQMMFQTLEGKVDKINTKGYKKGEIVYYNDGSISKYEDMRDTVKYPNAVVVGRNKIYISKTE